MLNLGIIDNENNLDATLEGLLKPENYHVSIVDKKEQIQQLDGLVIVMKTKQDFPNIIDWLLACQTIPNVFVWIFSEVLLESEETIMMSLGANDVVTSTANLPHLSIVIKNTFFRLKNLIVEKQEISSMKLLNKENQTVYINGEELLLTRKEFNVLQILYDHKNTTVRYEEFLENLWADQSKENIFLVSNVIFHLRNKVNKRKDIEIKTVRSKGYMLKIENDKQKRNSPFFV
ncbi:hypothetical protein IGJ02_002723 [Enterococcus sp. DIV0724b]|uniref:response regulator transcription factor n=1 Tax=Enterococcus sp. DIV0724b TaxID=2774694 RepID=UPI003D2FE900